MSRNSVAFAIVVCSLESVSAITWPIDIGQSGAPLTSAFGARYLSSTYVYDWHYGVDIRTSNSTTVVAAHDGYADWVGTISGYGLMIFLGDAYFVFATGYAHLADTVNLNYPSETPILQENQIAVSGGDPPHLHFNYYTRNVDELSYGGHPGDGDTDNPAGFLPISSSHPYISDLSVLSVAEDDDGIYFQVDVLTHGLELDFNEVELFASVEVNGVYFEEDEILKGDWWPNNTVNFNERTNTDMRKRATSYNVVNGIKTLPQDFDPDYDYDQELWFRFYTDPYFNDEWVSFYAQVTDLENNVVTSQTIFLLLGEPPPGTPSPPENVSATPNSTNMSIDLSWSQTAYSTQHYVVYRTAASSSGPDDAVAVGISRTNSAQISHKMTPGESYYFSVAAVNHNGEGGKSDPEVFATAPTNTTPGIPSNFNVSGNSGQNPKLTWNANSEPDLRNYNIYRRVPGSVTYLYLTSVPKGQHQYTDNTVTIGSKWDPEYCYKISAEDRYGAESPKTSAKCKQGTGPLMKIAGSPEVFALHGNYPNPFNPVTTIKYDLPENSSVTLKVYNLMGQEIRTLANGNMEAGNQNVIWDGKDSNGNPVSSGMYVYRFDAISRESDKEFHMARKMILLR